MSVYSFGQDGAQVNAGGCDPKGLQNTSRWTHNGAISKHLRADFRSFPVIFGMLEVCSFCQQSLHGVSDGWNTAQLYGPLNLPARLGGPVPIFQSSSGFYIDYTLNKWKTQSDGT